MNTHVTELPSPTEQPATWRAAQQMATNATWQASAAAPVAPFCISQLERQGAYVGDLHYADCSPVRAIAAEYDAEVSATPASGRDVCVSTRVVVDGIEVRAWAITQDHEVLDGGDAA